jgi:hypothetical protein
VRGSSAAHSNSSQPCPSSGVSSSSGRSQSARAIRGIYRCPRGRAVGEGRDKGQGTRDKGQGTRDQGTKGPRDQGTKAVGSGSFGFLVRGSLVPWFLGSLAPSLPPPHDPGVAVEAVGSSVEPLARRPEIELPSRRFDPALGARQVDAGTVDAEGGRVSLQAAPQGGHRGDKSRCERGPIDRIVRRQPRQRSGQSLAGSRHARPEGQAPGQRLSGRNSAKCRRRRGPASGAGQTFVSLPYLSASSTVNTRTGPSPRARSGASTCFRSPTTTTRNLEGCTRAAIAVDASAGVTAVTFGTYVE